MGRTVPTYRDALTELLARWEREFARSLTSPRDRVAFRELVLAARRYIPQGTMMSSGDVIERALLSLLLDLYRQAYVERERPGPATEGPLDRFVLDAE